MLFVAQLTSAVTNAAATPILPRLVIGDLGYDSTTTGLVVAVGAIAAIVGSPFAGVVADRLGFGRVTIWMIGISALGMAIGGWWLDLGAIYASRVVYYATMTLGTSLLTAWLVAIVPARFHLRALNFYGIAVWLGLAIGPQLGELVYDTWGGARVFVVCGLIQAVATAGLLLVPHPRRGAALPDAGTGGTFYRPWTGAFGRGVRQVADATRAVAAPGTVAAVAWACEGLVMTFLVVHLVEAGVDGSGGWSAASTLSIFGVSVIATRVLLTLVGDRLSLRATIVASLVALSAAMVLFAVATTLPVAAAGAVIIGVGFAPLFPALTQWSTRNLGPGGSLGTGLSVFGSFTTIGYAVGSLTAGVLIDSHGSVAAFMALGIVQLIVGLGYGMRARR